MKKMWMVVVVITTFVGFCGCEKTPVVKGGGDDFQGGEGYTLTGEWHEVNSTHDWGTKVIFTDTTMSIIGYGVFALEPDNEPIWHDTLLIYTQDLAYKMFSDSELEFAYRPALKEFPDYLNYPNYRTNYTFKSKDTLLIDSVWANSYLSVDPPFLDKILLCRRNK